MMTKEEAKKINFVYRKANFTLDSDKQFSGFTRGETWNGFACPYFTFEVATQLAIDYVAGNDYHDHTVGKYRWEYDRVKDAFVFYDPNDEDYCKDENDEYVPYSCEGMDIVCEGKTYHVYDIGCGAWVWDEVEKPLTCMDCNEVIEADQDYLESMPIREGGNVGTFCSSECAGNFFVRKMCQGKTNTTDEALPPQFGEPGYSEQNEQDYLAKRDIEYASEEVFTDIEHEEESMWCKDEPGSICHGCGDCEVYDEKKAQAFNHQQFEEGKTPWIMNYPDVYCFRGADADFNPDLNDLIKPYNLKKFSAFYWDDSRQRIVNSTIENTLERMF
jgi:hypothetical protein